MSNDQMKIVLSAIESLGAQMDQRFAESRHEMQTGFKKLSDRMNYLEKRMDGLEKRMECVETNMTKLDHKMVHLVREMQEVNAAVRNLDTRITNLESKMDSKLDTAVLMMVDLTGQFGRFEKRVFVMDGRLQEVIVWANANGASISKKDDDEGQSTSMRKV